MPKRRSMSGFTIIETMVVVSITLLLSTMLIAYNRSSERQLIIFRDQAVIFGTLNRAKAQAIEKFNFPVGIGRVSCGFGVHFDASANSFFIFADTVLEGSASNPCKSGYVYQGNGEFDSGVDPVIGLVNSLGNNIVFELKDGSDAIHNKVDIVFIAPDPIVTSTISLSNMITIKSSSNPSLRADIVISEAGQITLQ
ncbi:MAG: type II secretion system protein [Patescibacteria group bacterium]|nr:type II secretion system protein [Patescibacteria group bacterium]